MNPKTYQPLFTSDEEEVFTFRKQQQPAQPPNAWVLYMRDMRVKDKQNTSSKTDRKVFKDLGKQWRNETLQVKAEYHALALSEQLKYKQFNPTYNIKKLATLSHRRKTKSSSAFASVTPKRVKVSDTILNRHAPFLNFTKLETAMFPVKIKFTPSIQNLLNDPFEPTKKHYSIPTPPMPDYQVTALPRRLLHFASFPHESCSPLINQHYDQEVTCDTEFDATCWPEFINVKSEELVYESNL